VYFVPTSSLVRLSFIYTFSVLYMFPHSSIPSLPLALYYTYIISIHTLLYTYNRSVSSTHPLLSFFRPPSVDFKDPNGRLFFSHIDAQVVAWLKKNRKCAHSKTWQKVMHSAFMHLFVSIRPTHSVEPELSGSQNRSIMRCLIDELIPPNGFIRMYSYVWCLMKWPGCADVCNMVERFEKVHQGMCKQLASAGV
jgi:hypothetical protein